MLVWGQLEQHFQPKPMPCRTLAETLNELRHGVGLRMVVAGLLQQIGHKKLQIYSIHAGTTENDPWRSTINVI